MTQSTAESETSILAALASRPTDMSSAYSQSIYDDNDGRVIDEWPASGELALRYGQYGTQGFLLGFENTTAYTQPRPAPLPALVANPVLRAARLTPSPPPGEPLPLLSLRESPPQVRPQSFLAIAYESTVPWGPEPPLSLPTGPVKASEGYRTGSIGEYLSEKRLALNKRVRQNLQGYWLGRGTLRRKDQPVEESA
jgi:hypothetical protein